MSLEAPAFVVHSRDHLHAALAAGASTGLSIVALSGLGASAYAGPSWFAALTAAGAADFSAVEMTAILDCGDRAGDALLAMNLGLKHLIFSGHPEAAARLCCIAAGYGAVILDRRPEALDLLNTRSPGWTAQKYCEKFARP